MEKKKFKIIIEGEHGNYCAYSKGDEFITGVGNTVEECKKSAYECLEIQKELGNIPAGDYELVFKFDTESFFTYYKSIFTNVSLARITGINQHLISHYATGHRKPRKKQTEKIQTALHDLGRELLSIELV